MIDGMHCDEKEAKSNQSNGCCKSFHKREYCSAGREYKRVECRAFYDIAPPQPQNFFNHLCKKRSLRTLLNQLCQTLLVSSHNHYFPKKINILPTLKKLRVDSNSSPISLSKGTKLTATFMRKRAERGPYARNCNRMHF